MDIPKRPGGLKVAEVEYNSVKQEHDSSKPRSKSILGKWHGTSTTGIPYRSSVFFRMERRTTDFLLRKLFSLNFISPESTNFAKLVLVDSFILVWAKSGLKCFNLGRGVNHCGNLWESGT